MLTNIVLFDRADFWGSWNFPNSADVDKLKVPNSAVLIEHESQITKNSDKVLQVWVKVSYYR